MERNLRVTKEAAEVISELCSLLGIKHDIEKDSSSSARIITLDYDFMEVGYTGAVKPLVRRAGNRESGHEETGIFAAEPPSCRQRSAGWGRQLMRCYYSLNAGSNPYTSLMER